MKGEPFATATVPGPFQPVEQDPGLPPRCLAPQQADLAHPLDDMGPRHQGMAGLARRAFGIAGPALAASAALPVATNPRQNASCRVESTGKGGNGFAAGTGIEMAMDGLRYS